MRKSILLYITFAFLIIGNGLAQDKKINKKIDQSNAQFENFSYSLSINTYQKLLDKDKVPMRKKAEVLRNLGNSYYLVADYNKAAETYEQLFTQFRDSMSADVYFRYAQALKSQGKVQQAEKMMIQFATLSPEEAKYMRTAVMEDIGQYKMVGMREIFGNLRDSINFKNYSDFAPSFYEKDLIFSSDRDTGNLAKYRHTWTGKDFLDLYQVNNKGTAESFISKLQFEGEEFTTRVHESTTTFTDNGRTMYFTGTNFKDGKLVGDNENVVRLTIYKAVLNDEGVWQIANDNTLAFNSDKYSTANPTLSMDGNIMYFSSDMDDPQGKSDLFSVRKGEDGVFRYPKNLGPAVNTSFRETFPFVSKEDVLFFASDGHPGLGGLDVFCVQLKDGEVDGPVLNMGTPINSSKDDFTFIFDSTTRTGFFASNRNSTQGGEDDDIFGFIKTQCNLAITGTVRNRLTNEVLVGATVKVINDKNEEVLSTFTDQNGNFSVVVDRYKKNFVRAMIEGFVGAEEYLEIAPCTERMIDFYLEPIEAPCDSDLSKLLGLQPIVFFDFDKSTIRPDGRYQLDIVTAAMERYPSLKIFLKSHTDSQGPDSYNLKLSDRRAQASKKYILDNGDIAPDRIKAEGFGESELANKSCPNGVRCSDKEHEKNRRTEFLIDCN